MKLDRLSALDETYLVAETDEAPLHIGALALFSGKRLLNEHGHLRLNALRVHVENRLGEVPRFAVDSNATLLTADTSSGPTTSRSILQTTCAQ